ncbi:MAG: ABC transporter transmembrane domain-containing protein [Chitinophagales bacterium]|nr:ABC transporter transmembrane domain-containing protein [Chitinophagales bacterium]
MQDTDNQAVASKKRLSKQSIRSFMTLMEYMKPFKVFFFLGLLTLLLSTLTFLFFPFLISMMADIAQGKPFVLDKMGVHYVFDSRNQLAILLLIVISFQAIFSFARVYIFAEVNERVLADIRTSLFSKYITLDIPYFEKSRTGDLISRISTDIANLQELISINLAEFTRQIVSLIGGTIIIAVISPQLTATIIILVPSIVILAIYLSKFIKNISKKVLKATADATIIAEESFQNIHTVKAFTNEWHESKRYRTAAEKIKKLAIRAAIYKGAFISFIVLAFIGALVFVIWRATGLVEDGTISVGHLLAYVGYTIFIGGSVAGLGDLWSKIVTSMGAADRIVEVLHTDSETQIRAIDKHTTSGSIEYRNVSFHYPSRPDISIFNNLNFKISTGQTVALVGPSGAGKSTIVQLLLQYYKINAGQILIDGKDTAQMDIQDVRSLIAIVPQEVILFGGTIRENIAYGNLKASEEDILQAAKQANCLDFIQSFPEGLDTLVGERGIKLSGGQRQRIAIARAILKNPAILLLDEATSALDSESEKLVQDALEKLMKNRTSIVIAHRLSTIRNADNILVVQNGQIIESGTHEELSTKDDGVYLNLLKLQYQA